MTPAHPWPQGFAVVPTPPTPLCSNCLVELDADCFCSLCGRVDTPAAARAVLEAGQAYAAGRTP